MLDAGELRGTRLRGRFIIVAVEFTREPMVDAEGREAIAKTGIVGMRIDLLIRACLDQRELSVTLYHEILEAAAVAISDPPEIVMDFNEADFERVAHAMHD